MLLSTGAHGSAIQRVWCSKQRSRGFDYSITTLCVLTISGLYFLPWILHWHSGFSHLAGSHISCLTDLSWTCLRLLDTTVHWPFRVCTTRCTCTPSTAAILQTFGFSLFLGLLCNLILLLFIIDIVIHLRSHDI